MELSLTTVQYVVVQQNVKDMVISKGGVKMLKCEVCGCESSNLDEGCYYDINGWSCSEEYDIENTHKIQMHWLIYYVGCVLKNSILNNYKSF